MVNKEDAGEVAESSCLLSITQVSLTALRCTSLNHVKYSYTPTGVMFNPISFAVSVRKHSLGDGWDRFTITSSTQDHPT
jgi:hypothetical protein